MKRSLVTGLICSIAMSAGASLPASAATTFVYKTHAMPAVNAKADAKLDCTSAALKLDDADVESSDFTSVEDGKGGCTLSVSVLKPAKSLVAIFKYTDGAEVHYLSKSLVAGATSEMVIR